MDERYSMVIPILSLSKNKVRMMKQKCSEIATFTIGATHRIKKQGWLDERLSTSVISPNGVMVEWEEEGVESASDYSMNEREVAFKMEPALR